MSPELPNGAAVLSHAIGSNDAPRNRRRLASLSVWRRLTFERGFFERRLIGQFVIMDSEIVNQDGRLRASHFDCQRPHLYRAYAPVLRIVGVVRGHQSRALRVPLVGTSRSFASGIAPCGPGQNREPCVSLRKEMRLDRDILWTFPRESI